MDLGLALENRAQVEEFRRRHRTGLVTLLFTDIVESAALKQGLGEREAATLFQDYRALVRSQRAQFSDSEEIETAGDSFLLVFATPSQVVEFALLLQTQLESWSKARRIGLQQRVGIHLGEVVIEEHAGPGKAKDLYGGQLDVCARVMSLAGANQILMTRAVFDNARRMLKGEDLPEVGPLKWLNHGPYQFKGLEEPIEVCEVRAGAEGPVTPPTSTEKAQRVAAEGELVLGWRPAIGQEVPNTKWVLEEKLGEGGFGEVWLAKHQRLKEQRVFKFCFRADRVRSLKREVTLFRLLKERIGEHPNIVRLYDVFFDQPPFYLVEEYVAGKDLKSWCDAQGGIDHVPMATRLEIVAQAAEALQAAHDAGVIHRDVKPGNILVENPKSENPQLSTINPQLSAKLTDFGIGQVLSEEYLSGITRAGFTQTMMGPGSSSQTGTQMYMAPELFAGKPASIRSDIYSLGVVLYQLLVGDFTRPVTTDWAEGISDPLLRDDLKHCFAGKPDDRFAGAAQLAKNLRSLEKRQTERTQQQALLAARERAAYRRGMARTAGIAATIITVLVLLASYALRQKRAAEEQSLLALKANAQLAQNLKQSEWLRAEDLLAAGKAAQGLVYFARFLRQNPTDQVAANRILSALSQHTFALPFTEPLKHAGAVHSVSLNSDETRVVTASADKTAQVWDARTGQPVTPPLKHEGPLSTAEFSPDGERILTASMDGTARLWDVRTGQPLAPPLKHDDVVPFAQFSPDGKRVVTASWDGTARVWDAKTGQPVTDALRHKDRLSFACFSPDGERVVTASKDNTARLWDARTGQPIGAPLQHEHRLVVAAFSPDGKRVVTTSWDETARLWDAHTGQPLLQLKLGGIVWTAQFSPDGERLVTAAGKSARIWNVRTGEPLTETVEQDDQLTDVQFSPDGRLVVSASVVGVALVWDSRTTQRLTEPLRHAGGIWRARFNRNGRWLVTASQDGTARLWELHRGRFQGKVLKHKSTVLSARFNPDGNRIVTASADKTARLWDARTGEALGQPLPHADAVHDARFSPDGSQLVTASFDGTARVWDTRTGKPLTEPLKHEGALWTAAFSPNGALVATASLGGTARVWDARTGQPVIDPIKHDFRVLAAEFSPDGQRFVTGSQNRMAQIWDVRNGRALMAPLVHPDSVYDAQFSRDGRRLLTVSGDAARLWNAHTGELLTHSFRHQGQVKFADLSPDGRWLVTASADRSARIWEVQTGQPIGDLLRHEGSVETARFSPDGARVVTASTDRTARVWDARTAKPMTGPLKHDGPLLGAEFSPDGTRLLTACDDGTARIWEVPVAPSPAPRWLSELVEAICGQRFGDKGQIEAVSTTQLLTLKQQLVENASTNFYALWARWFFAVPPSESEAPSAPR